VAGDEQKWRREELTVRIEEEVSSVLDADEDSDLAGDILKGNMDGGQLNRPHKVDSV